MLVAVRLRRLVALFCVLGPLSFKILAAEVAAPASRNLIQNGSFEMDWMHNGVSSNTRFLLLDQSDWGYGQSDGQPDLWVMPESARLDTSAAKIGRSSLQLTGDAWQVVYLCGQTQANDGGSSYNPFQPLPADLSRLVRQRPMQFSAWCKTTGAAAGASLAVTLEYVLDGKITSKNLDVAFSKGPHDWEYRQVDVASEPTLGVLHAAVLHLIHPEGGVAWFDGVSAIELPTPGAAPEPNLLFNGDFSARDGKVAAGWYEPQLWNWVRRDYYRFTGWSHEDGKIAGGVALLPTTEVGPALQFTVLPGGNFAVASQPIVMKQDKPRPLRVEARVWADNLRWLEIMAKDERGEWLPQQDFAGAWGSDVNYRNRVVGTGTHDWEFVSKYFAPTRPVRELTLYLCARGFDGRLMRRNVVGTVRFADVQLHECGSTTEELRRRGVRLSAASQTPAPATAPMATDTWVSNFGERVWGDNFLRVRSMRGETPPALALGGPAGQMVRLPAEPVQGVNCVEWSAHYRVADLCKDWTLQYHFDGTSRAVFGTPPSAIAIRLGSICIYPDEALPVAINLRVSDASLRELGACRVTIKSPAGEKVLLETPDVSALFWKGADPRPPLLVQGHVDARHLISLAIPSTGLRVHSASDPLRDCGLIVELRDRAGDVILSQTSEPFGFMEKPPLPALPERITRSSVDPHGMLQVNGQPFFLHPFPVGPVGATDLGGVSRTLNLPSGCKIAPLPFPKELTFSAAQEPEWREKVRAFVAASQSDPKLLGYRFEHDGETLMWFERWKEMAACERKVADWARQVDPSRVIFGAEWLFGTGTLTPDSAKPFDFLDGLDVEPAFTWVPDFKAIRQQNARTQHLLAGMECYYYQSPELLRWRMYSLLRGGASDVGICPSGMLTVRPETISFLRDLYAEEARLEPMLGGDEPIDRSTCSNPLISLWERVTPPGDRYVVALGAGDEHAGELPFEIKMPANVLSVEVLFEGRQVACNHGLLADRLANGAALHVYLLKSQ